MIKISSFTSFLTCFVVLSGWITSESLAQSDCAGVAALRTTLLELNSADWDDGVLMRYSVHVDGNEELDVKDYSDEFALFTSDEEIRMVSRRAQLHQTEEMSVRILPDRKTINIAEGKPFQVDQSLQLRKVAGIIQDSILNISDGIDCEPTVASNGQRAWKVKIVLPLKLRRNLAGAKDVESIEYVVDASYARLYSFRSNYAVGSRIRSMSYSIQTLEFDAERPDDWPDVEDIVYDDDEVRSEYVTWKVRDVRAQN